jgi:cation transport ATPase
VVRDDLATIPAVIALSRRARRVVTANLVIAAVLGFEQQPNGQSR